MKYTSQIQTNITAVWHLSCKLTQKIHHPSCPDLNSNWTELCFTKASYSNYQLPCFVFKSARRRSPPPPGWVLSFFFCGSRLCTRHIMNLSEGHGKKRPFDGTLYHFLLWRQRTLGWWTVLFLKTVTLSMKRLMRNLKKKAVVLFLYYASMIKTRNASISNVCVCVRVLATMCACVCLVSAFFRGGGGCWKIHIFIIYGTYSMNIFRCYMHIFNWWICSFYVGSKPTISIYTRFPKSHTLFPCIS